ncbi:hypothetical protein DID88_007443 [Monilinia fructigena]|uniref:Uncharacterized protein n=1 Tax=Monilinia fructigena TaxID=38457 RepID=A0A395J9C3_9HELO|nr:hypothetical protein DID88_007443 [Monilinia fructigena]
MQERNPWEHWPIFWTGQEIGFSVLASVPQSDTVYPLLGRPQDSLSKAGDRQAIPAAYLTVHVTGGFDLDVYLDINGLWVSGDRANAIDWTLSRSEPSKSSKDLPLKTWKVKRVVEQLFTEWGDRAEWGQLHFTGPADANHQAGTSALLRTAFSRSGTLQNVVDTNFRGIMDEEPVFAFAYSFKLNSTFNPSLLKDPVIQFASARGLTAMRPLWASYYPHADALLAFHYHDFHKAFNLANNYSDQLAIDALQSGSEDYKDILALSARQVLGAASFSGTPDDPIIFFKEISSDGNMNTIDVIYPLSHSSYTPILGG